MQIEVQDRRRGGKARFGEHAFIDQERRLARRTPVEQPLRELVLAAGDRPHRSAGSPAQGVAQQAGPKRCMGIRGRTRGKQLGELPIVRVGRTGEAREPVAVEVDVVFVRASPVGEPPGIEHVNQYDVRVARGGEPVEEVPQQRAAGTGLRAVDAGAEDEQTLRPRASEIDTVDGERLAARSAGTQGIAV